MNVNSRRVFFELLKAGLWEKEVRLSTYIPVDFVALRQLADEQSVSGLINTGLAFVSDINISKKDLLQFVGRSIQLEQRNTEMNQFIEKLLNKFNEKGIKAYLVKGQGVAQCYERPLRRVSGDIDLYLNLENYENAKSYLMPLAASVEQEGVSVKHLGLTIDSFVVELHGTLHCGLSNKIDKQLDLIMNSVFEGNVRTWINGQTQVQLPRADEEVVYVFTHILQHFYKGGIGIRQFCDWCRLLWQYQSSLDLPLLETRLRLLGLKTEWKAFGTFAVEYLGMPCEAMPLIDDNVCQCYKRKAKRIMEFIMEVGNFGQNRDLSYYEKYPYVIRKVISLGQRCKDLLHHASIFPIDSFCFIPYIVFDGLRNATRGE